MAREPTDMVQFKLRLREDLRAKLEHVASEQNRSINAEVVARLDNSILQDGLLGGYGTAQVLRRLAAVIEAVEHREGHDWTEHRDTYDAALEAATAALPGLFAEWAPPSRDIVAIRTMLRSKLDMLARLASVDANLLELGQGGLDAEGVRDWTPDLDELSEEEASAVLKLYGQRYRLVAEIAEVEAKASNGLAAVLTGTAPGDEESVLGMADVFAALDARRP